jgi:hypothetical protein
MNREKSRVPRARGKLAEVTVAFPGFVVPNPLGTASTSAVVNRKRSTRNPQPVPHTTSFTVTDLGNKKRILHALLADATAVFG